MSHADFLTAPFDAPTDLPDLDPTSASRFYNRELSWLGFNWRVLQEAENPRVPLLERLRFLSISADNLDEFYTVRVAGLRELARAGNITPGIDGLSPAEQLVLINENARNLMHTQQRVLGELHQQMEAENIKILELDDLTDADRVFLKEFFLRGPTRKKKLHHELHVWSAKPMVKTNAAQSRPKPPKTGRFGKRAALKRAGLEKGQV